MVAGAVSVFPHSRHRGAIDFVVLTVLVGAGAGSPKGGRRFAFLIRSDRRGVGGL
jgi:hypothetical protein